ncbi:hypothetical protein [Enterovibrio calviensis]|uniref:hypothetical protein n=1 Tax=Enterovibrio calviensis TaxID=91359 RepID=UPI000483ADB0|nr:hypothetical protein [Enterovibrio calviensis]
MYSLTATGEADSGETVNQAVSFSVKDGAVSPPPGGDYPAYVAGTSYLEGDRVTGADSNIYECKPWPFTGWCASASYAPGDSIDWSDAWEKL